MKQSIVKSCGDVNDMRNNLKELQDHIVRVMNNKGWEGIQNQEKIEESMIRYFADNHKYHIAHYLNVGSGELFYNNITEKENGETETQ